MKKFIIICVFLFLIPVVSTSANTNNNSEIENWAMYISEMMSEVTGMQMANDATQEMLVLQKHATVDNNITIQDRAIFTSHATVTGLIIAAINNYAVVNYLATNDGTLNPVNFGSMNKFTINYANLYQNSAEASKTLLGKEAIWRIGFDNRNEKETVAFVILNADNQAIRVLETGSVEINLII